MPDAVTFGVFLAAGLLLLIVPGPAVLYVVARSVEGGRLSGLVSVLDVQLGTLTHVAFAAAGLSAVVASSAAAFGAVKWLGAVYLIWLGLHRLLSRGEDVGAPVVKHEGRLTRIFAQSVLVQVLNPKVALFFLAFLPQFVDPTRGAAWSQVILLGATLAVLGLLTDSFYALLGGKVGDWLRRRSAGFHRGERYVSGGIYLALGAAAAATGSGKD